MAPRPSKAAGSKRVAKKRREQVPADGHGPFSSLDLGVVANDEDAESSSSPSFLHNRETIRILEESLGHVANYEPQYPSLDINDGRQQAPRHSGFPRTPPMMPWKVHPSMEDMNKLRESPLDHQQRRILQSLCEDALTHIETTDGRSRAGSTTTSLQRLRDLAARWRWDDRYRALSYPHVSKGQGRMPWRCLNGECDTRLKVFTCESALKKHLDTHIPEGMRPFVCEEGACNSTRKEFLYPKDLERHFIKVHGIGQMKSHLESVECNLCDEPFARPDGLQRHTKRFKGKCADRARSRRKSAPATSIRASHTVPLAPAEQQPGFNLDRVPVSPISAATSSVSSSHTRYSVFTDPRRPTNSSATSAAAQVFEPEDYFNLDSSLYQFPADAMSQYQFSPFLE